MRNDTEKVCQQDPDLWFSKILADKRQAVSLCGECPFQAACLKDGEGQEYGIWGGVDKANKFNKVTRADYRRTTKADLRADIEAMARTYPDMTKADIGRRLGAPRTTVGSILARLVDA